MPWCQECAKYFVPNALTVEGKCPKCGREIAEFTINGKPLDRPVTHKTLDLKSLARSNGEDEDSVAFQVTRRTFSRLFIVASCVSVYLRYLDRHR